MPIIKTDKYIKPCLNSTFGRMTGENNQWVAVELALTEREQVGRSLGLVQKKPANIRIRIK